jgi:hypothetical protein
MSDDKRGAKRVSYPCEVQCEGVGVAASPLNPRISDISVTGAFIDSMITLPAGTRLKLGIPLPSGTLSIIGEVTHAMPNFGMGVRFVSLTAEQLAVIEKIVESA